MADNTVALGIKVPDAMASLGSVMGVAQGAQQLQSGALNLEQKRATLQSDILRARAESSRAQTGATGEAADLQEKQAIRDLFKDGPGAFLGQDGRMDFNKLLPAVMKAAPTKGSEFIQHTYAADQAATGAQKALLGLNADQRTQVGQSILSLGGEKPTDAKKKLDALVEQNPQLKPAADAAWKYHLEPASKDPNAFMKAAQQVAQGVMSIDAQNQAASPTILPVSSGGQTGLMQVPNKPMAAGGLGAPAQMVPGSVINQTPGPAIIQTAGGPAAYSGATNSTAPIGGLGEPAQTGPATTFAGQALKYPKREAGIPYAPGPSEAVDLQTGQQYRTGLISQQQALPTIKRNNEELLTQINKMMGPDFLSSGVLGAAKRNIQNWAGDPEYKQLSKDIANAQISMIKAGGGSMETDAGKQLVKYATGDETYPPKVLRNIALRAGSDVTKTDMEATAAEKFAKQFGDNNLNTFKQEWSKNADSRIFEAINLYNGAKNKASVKPEIDKLLGGDPKQRKEYHEKYQNIMKLYNTGSL